MESAPIGESPGESLKTGTRSNVHPQFVRFSPYSQNHQICPKCPKYAKIHHFPKMSKIVHFSNFPKIQEFPHFRNMLIFNRFPYIPDFLIFPYFQIIPHFPNSTIFPIFRIFRFRHFLRFRLRGKRSFFLFLHFLIFSFSTIFLYSRIFSIYEFCPYFPYSCFSI